MSKLVNLTQSFAIFEAVQSLYKVVLEALVVLQERLLILRFWLENIYSENYPKAMWYHSKKSRYIIWARIQSLSPPRCSTSLLWYFLTLFWEASQIFSYLICQSDHYFTSAYLHYPHNHRCCCIYGNVWVSS